MTTLTALLSALALAGSTAAYSQQQSVYFDVGSVSAGFGVPSSTYAAAAPFPGIWNPVDMDLAAPMLVQLASPALDIQGVPTAITFEWRLLPPSFPFQDLIWDEVNTEGDDQSLLDDGGMSLGSSEIRITGLEPGIYDIYTYALAPDVPTIATIIEVVGATTGPQTVGGSFAEGMVQETTHALHTAPVAAGPTLVIRCNPEQVFLNLTGLQIVPHGAESPLGSPFCAPNTTASGRRALLAATGSTVAATNDLALRCTNQPANVFSMFLASADADFVPNSGGSSGNLCLGGSIGRYDGPGQVRASGPGGLTTLPLNLAMIPTATGSTTATAGQTWRFQTWFRDTENAAPTSNFSNGLEVTLR